MSNPSVPRRANIQLSQLRPTQITVGMLEVKHKRKRLRGLEKRPAELVEFILEMPIRVVLGPAGKAYVIDHHHLALALLKEDFQTAPMEIEADFSRLGQRAFWKKMISRRFVHPYNARGRERSLRDLPDDLRDLKDDPYRSLAGFVRAAGGFVKTPRPFAEFLWAAFFRERIAEKWLNHHFDTAVTRAVKLAATRAAARLPGYIGRKLPK